MQLKSAAKGACTAAARHAKPPPRGERCERAAEGVSSVEDEAFRLLHDDIVVFQTEGVAGFRLTSTEVL